MADIDNDSINELEIGVIGGGSMGGGMTKLFAEHGGIVGFYDYEKSAVEALLKDCQKDKDVPNDKVHGFTTPERLLKAFKDGKPRVLVLSLPHGDAVDSVIDQISPHLLKGDIIVDCGNEWWENTERRQKKMAGFGVGWIGCGVSGGYQAARRGPSMSAGGDKEVYDKVAPLLEKWAAKHNGNSCLGYMGPGGAGNYVKMCHNGIEHAQMSIMAELYGLLRHQAGLENDEIADVMEKWYEDGVLSDNYLIQLGFIGLRRKDGGDGIGYFEKGVIEALDDKVVQDVDGTEGTGTWSNMETANRHVAAPSLNASHNLRTMSARKGERIKTAEALKLPQPGRFDIGDKDAFIKKVTGAAEAGIFAAFTQGFALISLVSNEQKWDVKLSECLRIWKAGCIIRSGGMTSFFEPIIKQHENLPNPLVVPEIAQELSRNYANLKSICATAIAADAVAPALQATLEYMKGFANKQLPTVFTAMQMEAFGNHALDLKSEQKPDPVKGDHHIEFVPA